VNEIIKSNGANNLICFGAVDEIVNTKTLNLLHNNIFELKTLEQHFFYYYLNGLIINQKWNGTVVFNSSYLKKMT